MIWSKTVRLYILGLVTRRIRTETYRLLTGLYNAPSFGSIVNSIYPYSLQVQTVDLDIIDHRDSACVHHAIWVQWGLVITSKL